MVTIPVVLGVMNAYTHTSQIKYFAFTQDVQIEEESYRITVCKTSIEKYHEFLSSMEPEKKKGLDELYSSSQKISANDLELFVSCVRTGDPYPEDYVFDEKAVSFFQIC